MKSINRRQFLNTSGGALILGANAVRTNAAGFLKGAGDIRNFSARSLYSGERISVVYWIDGEYLDVALDAISYFMRDRRTEEVCEMDPRVIDILSATHILLGSQVPFDIISGFRSQSTNLELMKNDKDVAQKSFHMTGQAVDVSLQDKSCRQIFETCSLLNAGGVGLYKSHVHIDCGPVRNW